MFWRKNSQETKITQVERVEWEVEVDFSFVFL